MSELKTCFKKVDYDLGGLLHYIEIGDIAETRETRYRLGTDSVPDTLATLPTRYRTP